MERSSHLYRALAAVPPWINYLLISSHSDETSSFFFYDSLIGICLCAVYLTCKAYKSVKIVKMWKTAFDKLSQSNVMHKYSCKLFLQLLKISFYCLLFRFTELSHRVSSYRLPVQCVRYVTTITNGQLISSVSMFSAKIVWPCGWTANGPAQCVDQQWQMIPNGKTEALRTWFNCFKRFEGFVLRLKRVNQIIISITPFCCYSMRIRNDERCVLCVYVLKIQICKVCTS